MAFEIRIVLKRFNSRLLAEEMKASILPIISGQVVGFDEIDRFEAAPATAPKLVTRRRKSDGTYNEDFAEPGELRFEFSVELTAAFDLVLDNLLLAHDSTLRTADQQRQEQDETDLDTLVANFPNWDSFNNTQRNSFLKLLSRVVLRRARNASF